jgi:hypothetical protein
MLFIDLNPVLSVMRNLGPSSSSWMTVEEKTTAG